MKLACGMSGKSPESDQTEIPGDVIQARWDCINSLEQSNVESAREIAINAIEILENLEKSDGQYEPDHSARVRTELEFFRFVISIVAGVKESLTRDFQGSANSFETAVQLAGILDEKLAVSDSRRTFLEVYRRGVEPRVPVMRAAESFFRGDPAAALRQLNRAEAIIDDLLKPVFDTTNRIKRRPDGGEVSSSDVRGGIGAYIGFFILAAPIYVGIASLGYDLDGAADFFDSHQTRVRTVLESQPNVADGTVLTFIRLMLRYAEACGLLVSASISLRDEKFDESLNYYNGAGAEFREISRTLPRGNAEFEMVRDICLNQATITIPQMVDRVRHEQTLNERINFLEAKDDDRARELRETLVRRDEIIKELVQPLGNITISTHAESSAQLMAQITSTISMSVTLQNGSMDQLLRVLDEMREKIPADKIQTVRVAAEEAKKENDLTKKIEKVANAIEAFGKIADAVSDSVPYGRTVYRVLRGIFG